MRTYDADFGINVDINLIFTLSLLFLFFSKPFSPILAQAPLHHLRRRPNVVRIRTKMKKTQNIDSSVIKQVYLEDNLQLI